MDSTTVTNFLTNTLTQLLPGLDKTVLTLIASGLTVWIVFGWEKILGTLKGGKLTSVTAFWEKWKAILNPILAILVGHFAWGSVVIGALAAGAKAATTTTVNGIKQMKGVVILLALLATIAGTASAGVRVPWTSPLRRQYALQIGYIQPLGRNEKMGFYAGPQMAYVLADHAALRFNPVIRESGKYDLSIAVVLR